MRNQYDLTGVTVAGIEIEHVRALIGTRNETPQKLAGLADSVHSIAVGVADCLAAGGTV
ncbi:MAG: hypothetical protein IH969_05870, partial [Candidatus Krumholzibacteriota bacterium]|nr:hypothetical protein [Candidatus Krumholzibacteriota bacterium]